MMRQTSKNGHRWISAVVLLVGGGAVAIAAWVGGQPGVAVFLVAAYIVFAAIAFVWSGGRGDVAAIMRGGGDERQAAIDLRAGALAAHVTAVFAVVGAIVSMARTGGNPGAYGVICMVFGISYGLALAVLHRRT